jgi:diguanylate cyclase (GGDEF)-like protein
VTRRVHSSLRPYDVLGRYGGEEFLIVLPGCDAQAVAATAERIRKAISASPIDTSEGLIAVTASMGTASARLGEFTAESLVRAADEALYVAKRQGRDRVAQASPGQAGAHLEATA